MHNLPVGIVGASGYAGMELTRLLAYHPRVELRFVTSDRWVGETVAKRLGPCGPVGALTYVGQSELEAAARGCKLVFLATPAEVSLALAPRLVEAGIQVIDLSGAFRLLQPADYPAWYGFEHVQPQLLAQAVYGLPELFRDRLAGARLVANPGCYATAATLPVTPLLRAGLIDPESLVMNAASGVTGAGRKSTEDFSFVELEGDFRAYRTLRHQHTPEIAQNLGLSNEALTFTTHLLPVKRGILCTTFARLAKGATGAQVKQALQVAYANEPFVSLHDSADEINLKAVVGTNRCHVGVSHDAGRVILVSAIDNLVKGAAGQAVQNLNALQGWEESIALDHLRGFHP